MTKDRWAGAGLGALVGSLLGFSSQSVVAGTIAAILTLVASFVGVAKPAAFAPAGSDDKQNERIIAFGVAATMFFGVCYFLAVRRALEPSPGEVLKELKAAGFPPEQAVILVGNKYFGAAPSDWKKATQ